MSKTGSIFKYSVNITPEIAQSGKMVGEILKQCRDSLKQKMSFYIPFQSNIYSPDMTTDEITLKATVDEQEYTVSVKFSKAITSDDPETYTFYAIFFKKMMRFMTFEQVGRNCFNPKQAVTIQGIEIWPGFFSAMSGMEAGPLMQIDLTSKVIRKDSVYDTLKDYESKGYDHDRIQEEVKGITVVTSYSKSGKHTYKVERIDFDKTPSDEFEMKGGEKISYANYFKKQYNCQIKDMSQPLLVSTNSRSGQEIYLVPEICEMTGLTDANRANFNLMRDLGKVLHKSAQQRIQDVEKLIKEMRAMKKVQEKMQEWKLDIVEQPLTIEGQVCKAGDILMDAQGKRFKADCQTNEFDRNIQAKMFNQKNLSKWCIIHTRNTQREANQFMTTIKQCLDQFQFEASAPVMFQVEGNDRQFQSWQKLLEAKINPSVTFIVFILPGAKGKGTCYSEIKQLLIKKIPVPNQVVLASTISRGKNLRSIVTKILIQMNAKLGGIPWSVTNLPFFDGPSMIVGLDTFAQRGKKSIMALVASMNNQGNRYFPRVSEFDGQFGDKLQSMFVDAFEAFKKANGIYPVRVIIYRNGVGEGQKATLVNQEYKQIEAARKQVDGMSNSKFMFVMCNTKVKTKMILKNGTRFDNPRPGTVIDHSIVKKGLYDFYLVSTVSRQGVPTPAHYCVLKDEIQDPNGPEKIQELTYKLSYLYYNFSGAVKTPAPLKYAYRLATLIGEHGKNAMPHPHYDNIKGLFFI